VLVRLKPDTTVEDEDEGETSEDEDGAEEDEGGTDADEGWATDDDEGATEDDEGCAPGTMGAPRSCQPAIMPPQKHPNSATATHPCDRPLRVIER
jgi:hypothetical protein